MSKSSGDLFDLKLDISDELRERITPYINIRNFLILFALVFFLVAWNRGIALIYALSALMLAVLLVAWVAPYLSLRGVSISRDKYLKAAVGETLNVRIELNNAGRSWGRMLEVIDRAPFAVEEEQQPCIYVPRLKKCLTSAYEVQVNWRGLHTLGPLQLGSSYPLGVRKVSHTVRGSEATALVYPSPFPIEALRLSRASAQFSQGNFLSPRHGGHDEFAALREYRSGDSLRHIHWAKSSQGQEFQVKEYKSLQSSVVSIVLDKTAGNNVGEGRFATFEFQVSIAVSIARYCIDRGIPVALYAGTESMPQHDCSEAQYRAILECLAVVQAEDSKDDYCRYLQSLIVKNPRGCWIAFGNDDNDQLKALKYHPSVSQLLLVRFDSKSFRFPLSTPARKTTVDADYFVSRNDNLASVFR